MRTIGVRSTLLLAVAAACGAVAALGRPWYGPSVPATDARMEDLLRTVGRVLTDPGGTTGWTALQTADELLAGLAAATALLLLLALVPALQSPAATLARWTALAAVAVVAVELVGGPGGARTAELRHGAFLGLAATLVLLACSWTVASAPSRRRTAPGAYTPPPPPPAYEDDGVRAQQY